MQAVQAVVSKAADPAPVRGWMVLLKGDGFDYLHIQSDRLYVFICIVYLYTHIHRISILSLSLYIYVSTHTYIHMYI